MPGILSHALFGDMVYRKLPNSIFLSKTDFLAGNLIPDLNKDKSLSHYYMLTGIDGLFIPNLELAKQEPERIKVVNATESIEQIHKKVV